MLALCFAIVPALLPCRVVRFEAETGRMGGATKVASVIPGYSGTGYVTGFTAQDCSVTIPFSVSSAGVHQITVGYHSAYGDKGFTFQVNSNPALSGTFMNTGSKWGNVSVGEFPDARRSQG